MSWLRTSSIGKKLIMSISGSVLVFFLLFHASMNVVAVFSADAYNRICAFLGANWYAVAATMIFGVIILFHFAYALLLTLQNRNARGAGSYAVSARPKGVEWASQHMFVLGAAIGCFIILHLSQFWYKMMFSELRGVEEVNLGGSMVPVTHGAEFIQYYFSHLWIVVVYLLLYVALWLHLSHGFWSAMQTIGWSNQIWLKRWKRISQIMATALCLTFALVTCVFYFKSLG